MKIAENQLIFFQKAGLEYLVRQPLPEIENPPLLLLMHGVGSNEHDMFSLAQHLPDNFLIVSARGPLTLGPNSFAWFQVSFATGVPVINYTQAENSRNTIIQFIDFLKSQFRFDNEKIYVGGFSQGGIMSYSVGLTRPDLIKGIAVMSGRLLSEVKPQIAPAQELRNLNIYISHGVSDNVLQIDYARKANEYLTSIQLNPDYNEFAGGHTITSEMLGSLIIWLKSLKH